MKNGGTPDKEGNLHFLDYKKQSIKAARGLLYGQEVVERLEKASTDGEIEQIMVSARMSKFRD